MQPPNTARALMIVSFGGLLLLCACGPGDTSGTGTDSAEEIIAVVGDRRITRAEFERELNERAMRAPGAFLTEANREKVLESMIQRELLLSKAEAEGFHHSPEIIRLTEEVIANRYREARLSAGAVEEVEISADQVSAYYLANSNRFRVPAMQRAGVLRLDLDPGLPADKRAEILERARNLHGQALEVSDEQFGELVRQYSDDQSSRYTGGDTGWLTRGQTSIRWPMEIVETVFELSQPGDLAPLVETEDAVHLVRLTESRDASLRSLSEVEATIVHRLQMEQNIRAQQEFFEALEAEIAVTVNTAVLHSIAPTTRVQRASPPELPGP